MNEMKSWRSGSRGSSSLPPRCTSSPVGTVEESVSWHSLSSSLHTNPQLVTLKSFVPPSTLVALFPTTQRLPETAHIPPSTSTLTTDLVQATASLQHINTAFLVATTGLLAVKFYKTCCDIPAINYTRKANPCDSKRFESPYDL